MLLFRNRLKCLKDSKDLPPTPISTLLLNTLVDPEFMLTIKFPHAYIHLILTNFSPSSHHIHIDLRAKNVSCSCKGQANSCLLRLINEILTVKYCSVYHYEHFYFYIA